MASESCNVFPTFTATEVSTSESLVTTFSESISTGFGSVSTVEISTCAFVDPTSPCLPTVSSSFITFPGDTTTVTVPATLTVDVQVTVLNTLFGTFCSSTPISSSDDFSTPTPTPSSTPPPFSPFLTSTDTPSSTTLIPIVAPPSPSLFPSDGSAYLSSFPTTSSPSPTNVPDLSTDTPSNSKRIAVAPVVGGAVGGVAVLLLLGFLTWRLVKKRQSKNLDGFFSRVEGRDDYHHGSHRKGSLIEKPSYQYGVVGQPNSVLVNAGGQNAFGNGSGTGQAQGLPQSTADQAAIGNGGGLGHASGQSSGLLGNGGGFGQASGLSGASHGVNMPSTAYTGDPSLIPLIQRRLTIEGASAGLLVAASSPSPSSRPSSATSSQVLGPLVTSTRQSWITNHGYAQAPSGPSTLRKNNNGSKLSISSVASTSSAYSNSSWVGDSSTNPVTNDNGSNVPQPILPSMEASSSHQQQDPRRDSFGRVLTVRQVTNNADHEYRPYSGVGSSSMGDGGVRSSQEVPVYNEQGRPLNMPPEKAPLVHLDGALYQEPSTPRDRLRSGYGPPAYIE